MSIGNVPFARSSVCLVALVMWSRAQSDNFERQPSPLEVCLEFVQPLHHAVIHEFRALQIHDHVVVLLQAKLAELPPKGNPV